MNLSTVSSIIPPTISRLIYMRAKQYGDVIDFTLGDPDIPTSSEICEAAMAAASIGRTRYTPNSGLPELREAIASYENEKHRSSYSNSEVAVTVGATQAIYLTLQAILNPGDEVVILAPYWVQYENITKLLGGVPKMVLPASNSFEPDIESVKRALSDRTKVVILNSPNNPSGHIYSDEFVSELSHMVMGLGINLMIDEVYDELVYEGLKAKLATNCDKEHLILIGSFSKAFAMTGWRLGYVLGPDPLIQTVVKLQQNEAVCASSISQYAGLEAMRNSSEYTSRVRNIFRRRRDVLMDAVASSTILRIDDIKGAFYAFIDISATGKTSMDFALGLLEEKHVAVVPGVAFGESFDNYIRLAFTLDEHKIVEGVKRLCEYAEE